MKSVKKLAQALLHTREGPLTRDLLQAPGRFGLGRVPARLQPDATTTMVCGFCSTGCGLRVHLKDGVAINLSPDTNYPVNLGMACPKGWEALTPLAAPDRALTPMLNLDGSVALDREEFPRPGTTVESLARLEPSFPAVADWRRDEDTPTFREQINKRYPDVDIQHVHHAGNSSGVVDGSGAVLYASSEYAKAHGLTPRARVVATANMGDDPTLMLNAPVPATRKVLERAGMTLDDIDLFEVNEAFAVVAERYMRMLDIDREKINVNGGAMALGHPIGATGAMLIGTVLDELERRDLQVGLITMCAGGGMAPAIIIERV